MKPKTVLHVITAAHPVLSNQVFYLYEKYFTDDPLIRHTFLFIQTNNANELTFDTSTIPFQVFVYTHHNLLSGFRLRALLRGFDLLVSHSFLPYGTLSPLWFLFPFMWGSLLRKTMWVEWGSEVHLMDRNLHPQKKTFKTLLLQMIFHRMVKRIPYMVTIFPPDKEIMQSFNSNAKVFYARYIGYNKLAFQTKTPLENTLSNPEIPIHFEKDTSVCNILIAHRCNRQIKPVETLRLLTTFKNQKIKIYIPFADDKADTIIDELLALKDNFPQESLVFIPRFLSTKELEELCRCIDVAVFNTDRRQIALGTIHLLFKAGAKLFLKKDSPMYCHYTEFGIPIGAIEEIPSMSFDDFSKAIDPEPGYRYVEDTRDFPKWVGVWKDIYHSVLKH